MAGPQSKPKKISIIPTLLNTSVFGLDLNIIYYVAGALVSSELKLRKSCSSCKELLLEDSGAGAELPFLTSEGVVTENVKAFYEDITRGGLLAPSTSTFGDCVKA